MEIVAMCPWANNEIYAEKRFYLVYGISIWTSPGWRDLGNQQRQHCWACAVDEREYVTDVGWPLLVCMTVSTDKNMA